MKVSELFEEKYVCFKNKLGPTVFWAENAVGYTGNLREAGIYTIEEVVKKHKLTIVTSDDLKRGNFRKYTHFATTLSDAVKFFQ